MLGAVYADRVKVRPLRLYVATSRYTSKVLCRSVQQFGRLER
jgi:hypothetical protein